MFLTVAIPVQLGDSAWTTIAWAAEGAAITYVAFQLRLPNARIAAMAVFGLVAIRLYLFDTGVDLRTYDVILNERMLAFRSQHRRHVCDRVPVLA